MTLQLCLSYYFAASVHLEQQLLRHGQGYGGILCHVEASLTLHADAAHGKQRHGRGVCEDL